MAQRLSKAPSRQVDPLQQAVVKAELRDEQLSAVRKWLSELLIADEYAKLGQGGHARGEVPLRRVFVDLPYQSSTGTQHKRSLFLAQFMASTPVAPSQLFHSPLFFPGQVEDNVQEALPAPRTARRQRPSAVQSAALSTVLLIGGPGQGKSTLGQLACQLHRVSLLRASADRLTSREREVLRAFEPQAPSSDPSQAAYGLEPPTKPCIPLHVALPELASWLATDEGKLAATGAFPSVLAFICQRPSAQNSSVTPELLLGLARALPVLLVADGFDEVGARADREAIVQALSGLLKALQQQQTAVKFLATTRPQGYMGELSGLGVALVNLQLCPLLPDEALQYGQKLIEAKVNGLDQQQKILKRLQDAARSGATVHLLTTPLQVTIMTALVQQGRAPRERWRLFYSYFDYTYKREVERDTYASALLAEHRTQIETLHTRVGLLLQTEAELEGGANARMTEERLRLVIRTLLLEERLVDQPMEEDERRTLEQQVSDLVKAAGERLVFLVEPEPGQFGFEIRSLQEFMAAWALSSGADALILERMGEIARSPMFRNVLLFMASRLYCETSHLRENLPQKVCARRGTEDPLGLDEGAVLALEILEEGAVLTQSRQAAELLNHAVRLLDEPADDLQARLARVTEDSWGGALRAELERRLATAPDATSSEGAWVCLLEAINLGRPWAASLAEALVPLEQSPLKLVEICRRARIEISAWLARRVDATASVAPIVVPSVAPSMTSLVAPSGNFLSRLRFSCPPSETWFSWVVTVLAFPSFHWVDTAVGVVKSVSRVWVDSAEPEYPIPPALVPFASIAQFTNAPTHAQLQRSLSAIASCCEPSEFLPLAALAPWPLAACLSAAESSLELLQFAQEVGTGKLGTGQDWKRAEQMWMPAASERKWTLDHVERPWNLQRLQDGPSVWCNYPLPHWMWQRAGRTADRLEQFSRAFQAADHQKLRHFLGLECLSAIRGDAAASRQVEPSEIRQWLEAAPEGIQYLIPRPAIVPRDIWLQHLDKLRAVSFARRSPSPVNFFRVLDDARGSGYHPGIVKTFVELYADRPMRELAALRTGPMNIRVRLDRVEKRIDQLGMFYREIPPTTPELRAFAAVLQALARQVTRENLGEALEAVRAYEVEFPRGPELFCHGIGQGGPTESIPLLRQALTLLGREHSSYGRGLALLRNKLEPSGSGLQHRTRWRALGLPQPLPASLMGGSTGMLVPESPVVLTRLELQDARGIPHLVLELTPPPPDEGQWTVLLGPNGVGKTTLLRSLVLAFRNVQDPALWPDDVFRLPWPRAGAREARITVSLADGRTSDCKIRAQSLNRVEQVPPLDQPRLFPLFAYGCRRGSALGGRAREVNLKEEGGPEVATLFSEGRDLIHAETWLLILDGDASRTPAKEKVFKAIRQALLELLEISDLKIEERRVWVRHSEASPWLLFESLSDGYLTTAGWFLDFVARWIELLTRAGQDIPPDFLAAARALILIDELDLHLHPRWQTDVIGRMRKLLPQVSFVVTTHNPLTLVGARPEEIWVLSGEGSSLNVQRGSEPPLLLTGGQLLRHYFQIRDIYPSELGRMVQRYSRLCTDAGRSEAEEQELQALSQTLQKAGILPEWEVVPRLGGALDVPVRPDSPPSHTEGGDSPVQPRKKRARGARSV